jgi:hypothetical protein
MLYLYIQMPVAELAEAREPVCLRCDVDTGLGKHGLTPLRRPLVLAWRREWLLNLCVKLLVETAWRMYEWIALVVHAICPVGSLDGVDQTGGCLSY